MGPNTIRPTLLSTRVRAQAPFFAGGFFGLQVCRDTSVRVAAPLPTPTDPAFAGGGGGALQAAPVSSPIRSTLGSRRGLSQPPAQAGPRPCPWQVRPQSGPPSSTSLLSPSPRMTALLGVRLPAGRRGTETRRGCRDGQEPPPPTPTQAVRSPAGTGVPPACHTGSLGRAGRAYRCSSGAV